MTYEVCGSATGLVLGSRVTAKEIEDLPGMGGVERLLSIGAICVPGAKAVKVEPTGDAAADSTPPSPEDRPGKVKRIGKS